MIVWTPTVFECLICMHFLFFVFAPVQRNQACFTWKSALEIRSLLLLLLLLLFYCMFEESREAGREQVGH